MVLLSSLLYTCNKVKDNALSGQQSLKGVLKIFCKTQIEEICQKKKILEYICLLGLSLGCLQTFVMLAFFNTVAIHLGEHKLNCNNVPF